MKKVLSTLLSCAMCLVLSTPAMAICEAPAETTNAVPVFSSTSAPSIYSPEFPDAYILQNGTTEMSISHSTTQTVSATVFVEEEYGFDNDGNPITISSRLLSESEVLEIGLENFENMEDVRQDAVSELMQTRAAFNGRGSLSISFSGGGTISGKNVTYDLNASASWSPSGWLWTSDRDNNPASGADYVGVTWSGGYTVSGSPQINTTTYRSIDDSYFAPPLPPTLCDAVPSAGRVWEFYEYWETFLGANTLPNHYTNISIDMKLVKNNIGDNEAETVMKYIHTFSSTKGSVSITANSSGVVSGGFSLTGVDKQWSIVCTLTGLKC